MESARYIWPFNTFYVNEVECISIWLEFSEYFFCGLAKEEEEKKPRERENFEELKSVR